jgi:selenocysteine lyase/cysteine desulfurase/tRNA(Ile)-lysidine synthase TilS/MesJ
MTTVDKVKRIIKSQADKDTEPCRPTALDSVRRSVVGHGCSFEGPFGRKVMLYADWTASGRPLRHIENYLQTNVLPMYANTHTTTSSCGLQSTFFRQEARQIIAQACNARVGHSDKHADVVIFAGNGSTGAINKLALILGVHLPIPKNAAPTAQPVVLVGPHEHHSNILPWRESAAKVVHIPEVSGGIDRAALRQALLAHSSHSLVIGSFSAASNITGLVADVDGITEELHRAGALAFWDYAAAAPYLNIDMNPVRFFPDGALNPYVYKDAVFISPHKFPGGPGAPGVLVAKRSLFVNEVPCEPGGGTVFFVTGSDQRYLSSRQEREEGGTQDIIGSIRAGLAFQVKQSVGESAIREAETTIAKQMYDSLMENPNIAVLGPPDINTFETVSLARLPVISFLVRGPADGKGRSRFLHHSFVCAVLNDVFGVQVRGGCACAGPYALQLLGLGDVAAAALETLLLDQAEVMRPGFVRLSLPYFSSVAEIEYALSAIHAVANHGWRLLMLYRLDSKTGDFRHMSRARSTPERRWLAHLGFPLKGSANEHKNITNDALTVESSQSLNDEEIAALFKEQLAIGLELLEQCGQQPAGPGLRQHLKVPAINELEISGEQNMLTSGHCKDNESEVARPRHELHSTNRKLVHSSAGTTSTKIEIDAETADLLRWFMFPSEGATVLRAALSSWVPRKHPKSGSHLPLAVQPPPGRLAGVIRPPHYDDTIGVTYPDASPWPTGLDRLMILADLQRCKSSKYPLRVSVDTDGIIGGLAHQRALHVSGTSSLPCEVTRVRAATPMVETSVLEEKDVIPRGQDPRRQFIKLDGLRDDESPDILVKTDLPTVGENAKIPRLNFCSPPKKLMHQVTKAVAEWKMISPGDRVLLGLSGGKDSLAMLHLLKALQMRYPPGTFELACCTIDPGTEAFNPRPLIPYVESLGIRYHYNEERIMDMASKHMSGDSICAFCARMKRGAMYTCMRQHGYNKLVLAQHLDDLVESFFMSAMHNGLIRTMKACYVVDEGDLTVIRPGIYCRERQLRDFSYAAGLPVINENCPACFEEPKERQHIKKLLSREEGIFPTLYPSLRKALLPLLDPAAMDLLSAIRRTVEQQSKVGTHAARQRVARKGPSSSSAETTPKLRSETMSATEGEDTKLSARTLSEASEDELLAELVQRRQMSRHQGRHGVVNLGQTRDTRDTPILDMELQKDVALLNQICTADGCESTPVLFGEV